MKPKDTSHAKLALEWVKVINTFATEFETISDKEKKKATLLLQRKLRLALIAFFGPIASQWWNKKMVGLKKGDEWSIRIPLFDEDQSMFQTTISRMLSADCWIIIEAYYRGASEDNIWNILKARLGTIPPALDTLRLIRNSWHSLGIHTGKTNVTYKVRGYTFKFKKENR